MRADGVDPGDKRALDAWMAAFNDRPHEERSRILGMPAESRESRARREKRKATRAARKRNRR